MIDKIKIGEVHEACGQPWAVIRDSSQMRVAHCKHCNMDIKLQREYPIPKASWVPPVPKLSAADLQSCGVREPVETKKRIVVGARMQRRILCAWNEGLSLAQIATKENVSRHIIRKVCHVGKGEME